MRRRKTLPKRLAHARKSLGMTQKDLGICVGIDPQQASSRMNRYEKGIRYPDEETLERIAQCIDLPVSFFCEPDDQMARIIWQLGRMSTSERENLLAQISHRS